MNIPFAGALVPHGGQQQLVSVGDSHMGGSLIPAGPPRTSSLQAPIMRLFGHKGEIFACKFSPTGATLASGSYERLIFLWSVYEDCDNYLVMKGHQGAIMELQYSMDGSMIFTAATDKQGAVWDAEVGVRVKKLKGHSSFVNSIASSKRGTQVVATGSDDGTARIWDLRSRFASQNLNATYQVTAVSFNLSGDLLLTGGLDNIIKVWDLRKEEILYTLNGHNDTVTGLSVSPNGQYVCSNGMDNTIRIWDIKPFVHGDRQLRVLYGAQHNFEKNLLRCAWSPDGRMVAAGSADRYVYVWDSVSGHIRYKLPGHQGSVNDVDFHPKEQILLSCSSDKTLYLGELQ